MTEYWYYLDSGKQTPAYNMAADECLLHWHSKGEIPPVIRFYEWKPAGLSVGYFQKTKNRIDGEAVKQNGFDLVRRLTGGRAVLHDDELTYSVIVSEDHPKMPASIKEAYLVISKGLLQGLQALDIPADFAIPEGKLDIQSSAVCFEEPSWYEIIINGKKAIGSAQTRKNGVILQHGSIPITIDNKVLYDMFLYKNDKVKDRAMKGFKDKATSLTEATNRSISIADLKTSIKNGIEQALNIQLKPFQFSQEQEQAVLDLAEKKYKNDEWNLSR